MSFWNRLKQKHDAAEPGVDGAVMRAAAALAASKWTTAILLAVAIVAIVMWASCGCPGSVQ